MPTLTISVSDEIYGWLIVKSQGADAHQKSKLVQMAIQAQMDIERQRPKRKGAKKK